MKALLDKVLFVLFFMFIGVPLCIAGCALVLIVVVLTPNKNINLTGPNK